MAEPDVSAIAAAEAAVAKDIPQIQKDIHSGNLGGLAKDAQTGFLQIGPLAGSIIQESKAGYKTTEFWIALISVTLTQLGTFDLPGQWGKIVATVSILVSYILSRGIAKAGVGNQVKV